MNIGSKDLDALRQTASKALIALLWLHVPIAMAVGLAQCGEIVAFNSHSRIPQNAFTKWPACS